MGRLQKYSLTVRCWRQVAKDALLLFPEALFHWPSINPQPFAICTRTASKEAPWQ
jgi:hypothetical protein